MSLNDAYSLSTPEDSRRLYASWAKTYDEDFVFANAYSYPRRVAEVFIRQAQVPRVIDVGCGTGAIGEHLVELDPEIEIVGVDISPEMLSVAATKRRDNGKSLYSKLYELDLTKKPKFAGPKYESGVSAGTFTHGHLGPEALLNVIALVRPDGLLVIGINAAHFANQGFSTLFDRLVAESVVSTPLFDEVDIYDQGSPHHGDKALIASFTRLR